VKKRSMALIGIIIVGTLLAILRISLPYIMEHKINKKISGLEDYKGEISEVDIKLWRGAYEIENLRLVKTSSGGAEEPFLLIDEIDLSLQWNALFRGAIVGEATLSGVDLKLIEADDEETSQTGESLDWGTESQKLFPFKFNKIRVTDSQSSFRTPGIDSPDALTARDINAEVLNLTNITDEQSETFSEFDIRANVLEAPLTITGALNPIEAPAVFDVNLTLEQVSLPEINPWFREYLGVDAHAGYFELYLEVAAQDGAFDGYTKPLMTEVDFFRIDGQNENIIQAAWEGIVDLSAELLENQSEDQIAANIPFSGSLEEPEIDVFSAVVSVLRNAFIEAFANSLELSISLPLNNSDEQEND